MKYFKRFHLLSQGALFLTFLLLQRFFCPKEEVLALGIAAFVFYIAVHAFFLYRWSRPLEKMIESVAPFRQGGDGLVPKILFRDVDKKTAFAPLAIALNALTEKVQSQIEKSHKKDKEMEGILESLNEGVIALNEEAKVIFANQMACKMLSISKEALNNRFLNGVAAEGSLLEKCHETVQYVLQTSETAVEKWTKMELHYDLVSAPLIHQAGVILVIQDKTADFKVLEVGKTFIANASHELRTPITIIRGFAEMLQNDSKLSLQTKLEITEKIVKTCDRLDKLVHSLMRISDLENVSLDRFRPCNLVSLIDRCKYFLLSAYPNVKLEILGSSEDVFVLGDMDLLELALRNLLENGVKYSPSPAEIEMGIRIIGPWVEIWVSDRGIGIPSEDLPRIFDRFYTVDKARSRKSGGAGLGLSIVKTIMEKHLGFVSVKSEVGKGSSFTLMLPLESEMVNT